MPTFYHQNFILKDYKEILKQLFPEKNFTEAIREYNRGSFTELPNFLCHKGLLTPEECTRVMAKRHHLPFFSPSAQEIPSDAISKLTLEQAWLYKVLPVAYVPIINLLVVAISDPDNLFGVDAILHEIEPRLELCLSEANEPEHL